MHNAACRALGLDAVYVALQVPAASLPAVLAMQAAIGGAGNVTVRTRKQSKDPSRGKRMSAPRGRVQYLLD